MKEEAASSTCRPAGPGVWKANTRELLHVPSAGNDECQLQTATENQSKKSGQAEGATAGALAKLSNKMGTKMSDRLFGYMEHM